MAISFANAQDFKYGVRGGLDMMTVSGGSGSVNGFYVGGLAEFELNDSFVLQPGLNYHTLSSDGTKSSFLSIPVLVKYAVAENISLLVGPSMYYIMEATTENTSFSLDLGGSYAVSDNFFIDPRYSIGMSGVFKTNHLLIGVGYKF